MIVPWVSCSRHRSRGSTEIVRDPAGFLLIPLQCLSQLFFVCRPTCANLNTRLCQYARATRRPSRVASESNGLIEREGVFSLCCSGRVCSLAHRCDPLSPWAAGFSRCMLGPAVLAPPFSGRTRSGRGCRSTTTPTRARLHLPLSLSHQTRDREIRYEPPRTFRTENRRD